MKNKVIIGLVGALLLTGNLSYAQMNKKTMTLFNQAVAFEEQNDFPSAIDLILQAIEKEPNEPLLYTKLAGYYKELGNYDASIDNYKKVFYDNGYLFPRPSKLIYACNSLSGLLVIEFF